MKLCHRIEVADRLGECILWDGAALWWTDIDGRRMHRCDWASGTRTDYSTPARLTAFAFLEGRSDFLAAFEHGLALFDPREGRVGEFVCPDGLCHGLRLNDGRVDRQGRFWIGSMVEGEGAATARLYSVRDGRIETHLESLGIANGLAFSPDGRCCYFADSRAQTIWRFAVDPATGVLSERSEFARSQGAACPDGACVDSDGCLWSAQWDGGCVVRYSPDGCIDFCLELPVSRPTCVAFAGPGLDHLVVTTARGPSEAPECGAGDVFVYNAPVRGLPESCCRLGTWPEVLGLRE
jgi:sugar lactone lactonase YvrE